MCGRELALVARVQNLRARAPAQVEHLIQRQPLQTRRQR